MEKDNLLEDFMEFIRSRQQKEGLSEPRSFDEYIAELDEQGKLNGDRKVAGIAIYRQAKDGLMQNFWGNRKFQILIILATMANFLGMSDEDTILIDPDKMDGEQIERFENILQRITGDIEKVFNGSEEDEEGPEEEWQFTGLSDFVKYHAKLRGWSQADLVRKTGLSNFAISRIFSGYYTHFNQTTYNKIANAFNIELPENILVYKRGRKYNQD